LAKPEEISSHSKWLEQENVVIESVPPLSELIFMSQKQVKEENTYVPAFVAFWRVRFRFPYPDEQFAKTARRRLMFISLQSRTQFSINLTC
jgi:hypothetical protein